MTLSDQCVVGRHTFILEGGYWIGTYNMFSPAPHIPQARGHYQLVQLVAVSPQ